MGQLEVSEDSFTSGCKKGGEAALSVLHEFCESDNSDLI